MAAIRIGLLGLGAALSLAHAGPAAAQDALAEVVVTAQKRSENIQNVPISITAYSSAQLASLGIAQPIDLAAQTPGLFAKTTSGNSAPVFYIRGIGLNDFFANNNPSTSIYVDQVLLPFHPMLSFAIFDTQRVEVLEGPQGTLYGRNNTGGAVNFITNKPTDEASGYISADYGNFSDRRIEAAFGGPMAPTLTGRLAVTAHRSDGFQQDEYSGRDVGGADDWAARGLLRWRPNDAWDILFNFHGGQDRGEVQWFKLVNSQNPNSTFTTCAPALAGRYVYDGSCTDVTGYHDPNSNIDKVGGSNPYFGTTKNNRTYGGSATMDIRLPRMTLTSLTSYDWFRRYEPISVDGSPQITVNTLYNEHIWSAEQELRLTSDRSWPFQWIGGVFFSADAIGGDQQLQSDEFLPLVTGIPAPLAAVQHYDQKTRSYAAFGQTTWTLAEGWHLVSGLRYTHESKQFIGGSTFIQDYVNYIPLTRTNDTITANDVSGKLALQYTPFDGVMVYASLDKGFKSGGFNAAFSSNPAQLLPYGPEKLWAAELGVKSTLLNNTLTLNGAFYNYWWRDFQAQVVETSSGIPLQVLANAGDARNYGFELQSAYRPLAGLELQLNANYLHTLITDGQYAGQTLSNAPKVTVGAVARYVRPLGDAPVKLVLQADGNYRSSVNFALAGAVPALDRQAGFGIVNARMGLTARDEHWETDVWVKNAANKRYLVDVFDQSPVNIMDVWNMPRTYGVSLNYRYH